MSNDIALRPLLEAAKAVTESAWSDAPCQLGYARTKRTGAYAAVMLGVVTRSFQGVNCSSAVEIKVLGRWPMPGPTDDPVELVKADRINAAIAEFQNGPTFTDYGALPIISEADPRESEDLDENFYQVLLTLTIQTSEDHH